MKEKPILFKPDMILAIDEDIKSMTRRLNFNASVGDRLWIKEPHWMWGKYSWTGEYTKTGKKKMEFLDMTSDEHPVIFSLDRNGLSFTDVAYGECIGYHPRTSLFMPKKYARKWLEITNIRVERLQDITVEDMIAEGLSTTLREFDACCHLKEQWIQLWDSINADRAPWESNPLVWVIEFKRIK